MRREILVCICLMTGLTVQAQGDDNRYSFSTSIGTGIDLSRPATTPFEWQVASRYRICDRFSVGMGTGIHMHEKALVPLFANMKLRLVQDCRLTPFFGLNIGYSFAIEKESNGGIYICPSVGVQYPVFRNFRVFITVNYELQKLERLKTYEHKLFTAEFAEQLNHNLIAFQIGIEY